MFRVNNSGIWIKWPKQCKLIIQEKKLLIVLLLLIDFLFKFKAEVQSFIDSWKTDELFKLG